MATSIPRRTRLEPDQRRTQILASARRLFSERHHGAVSTEEIAREAGVARGLLHHYFGTRRDLYLEVVRSMLRLPAQPVPEHQHGGSLEEALAESVDRWLTMVQRNRATWLAAVGAQGLGRDPEVEAILEEAREATADRVIEVLSGRHPKEASAELRALVRAYAGFAERASLEWLQHRRVSREQVREMLLSGLLTLFHDVLPRVELAGDPGREGDPSPPRPRRRRT